MTELLKAVADTIKETCEEDSLGLCPLGPIYAALNSKGVDYENYELLIQTLKNAKLIEVSTGGETAKWIVNKG